MKLYCTHCFDTEEIVTYIEWNGTLGHCPICDCSHVKRIKAEQIGRLLKAYLDDTYRDRKAEIVFGQPLKRKELPRSLQKLAEEEGWQSIEEILIEDKAIFAKHIAEEKQMEMLENMFAEEENVCEAYADVRERRFVPK